MRTNAQSQVTVDFIQTKQQVGELAKLGSALGVDVLITTSNESTGAIRVSLRSRDDRVLFEHLAVLVAIESTAQDRPVEEVFEQIRGKLRRWDFPTDKAPSDAREIGAGRVENE